MQVKDKVVIVTGAGSGIGRATALHFAHHGAKVVVSDINDERRRVDFESLSLNSRYFLLEKGRK